jgi:hypothetical protein
MKQDRLVLIVVLVLAVGFVTKLAIDSARAAAIAAHQSQQHEAMRKANEEHRKRLAYAEHLKRAAYDAAHPAEVALRKAKAAEALRALEAAKVAEQAKRHEADRIAAVEEPARQARQNRETHPCETASDIERQTADLTNGSDYQAIYDSAVSGLHYTDLCDNENARIVDRGFLLSFKAEAEHYLSSGDSRTDMNQATTLLAQCQTLPGIYGTHLGAVCESQEENNIRRKMNWDMGS